MARSSGLQERISELSRKESKTTQERTEQNWTSRKLKRRNVMGLCDVSRNEGTLRDAT